MNPENLLVKRQIQHGVSFPAKVFAYLLLCKDTMKANENEGLSKNKQCPNNLPLISELTMKSTPQGLVHARLSFLKYCH